MRDKCCSFFTRIKFPFIIAVLVLVGFSAGVGTAQDHLRPSRGDVSPESFPALHKLIGPHPGDYRWDEVAWVTSIWHARERAVAEDKPILVFGTGGAGFNDPLGNC